jgi:hypothetical protein
MWQLSDERLARAGRPLTILGLCVAAGLYSVHCGTDANWDLKNYHLYNPLAYLHDRLTFDVAPAQIQSYYNPLPDLPYYWLLENLNHHPRLVAFLLGIPAGIYAYATLRIALLVARIVIPGRIAPVAGLLAALIGLTGAGFMPLIGTTTHDVDLGIMILGALYFFLSALSRPNVDLRPVALAGLSTGVGIGIKLVGVIYAAPLGILVLITFGLRGALVFGIPLLASSLVFLGSHTWSLWSKLSNPLFPYFNNIFRSPDWLPLAPADVRFVPASFFEALVYPFLWATPNTSLVSELTMRDLRLALAISAITFAFIELVTRAVAEAPTPCRGSTFREKGRRCRVPVMLLAFVMAAYALWVSLFGIYRYFIVVESLSGVCMLVAASFVFRRQAAPTLVALAVSLIVTNIWVLRPDWGHVAHGERVISVDPLLIAPGSLIVIADDAPHGYLVLFMPPESEVISINNNFIQPQQAHALNRRMQTIVASHTGPVFVIVSPSTSDESAGRALSAYGLVARECRVVRTNIEPGGHKVCTGVLN